MKTLLCISVLCIVSVSSQLVDIEYGEVLGRTLDVFNGRDTSRVSAFLGIPFAQRTAKWNRFQMPKKPLPWGEETFVATRPRQACPQNPGGILALTHPGWDSFGENCLHINIYTPADFVNKTYPVMFYIHGGGFSSGMNNQYPGYFLATHGVVVATINYRMGIFGFAYTGQDNCPGNVGLFDQKMGLQFVIDNIAKFGGDPGKITVFGESAGAASASYLMLSPHTKDMFQQAIMESGGETNSWALTPAESEPVNMIRQVAENLCCTGNNDTELVDCMQNPGWDNVLSASRSRVSCPAGYPCSFNPMVDGVDGFLPMLPRELRETSGAMSGPIISGHNNDEMGSAVLALGGLNCCSQQRFRLTTAGSLAYLRHRMDNVTLRNTYKAFEYNYSPWPYTNDLTDNRARLIEMFSDSSFDVATDEQLKAHAQVAPTYGYVYNYRGRNLNKVVDEVAGVFHAMEVMYVWGHTLIHLPGNEAVAEHSGIIAAPIYEQLFTDEDTKHTLFLQELFTNFVKTGDPTPEPVNNPDTIGGTTTWPQYTLGQGEGNMKMLVISNTSVVAEQRQLEDYSFWLDYLPYVTNGELPAFDINYGAGLETVLENTLRTLMPGVLDNF